MIYGSVRAARSGSSKSRLGESKEFTADSIAPAALTVATDLVKLYKEQ
jgi:hypothetical protein